MGALGGSSAGGMAKAGPAGFGSNRSREHAPSRRPLASIPGGGRGWLPGSPDRLRTRAARRSLKAGHKQLSTVLGAGCDAYYHCADCGGGVVPKDGDLDLASTSFSPGVRRMMGRVGAKEPFQEGQRDLEELAGVAVSTKAVERVSEGIGDDVQSVSEREREQAFSEKIVPFASPPAPTMYVAIDGTGVPVRPAEVEGRVGKGGGAAKTREAKLGCVFAQTRCDEQGRALRDPDSTTYVGAIEEAAAFGARIYTEAARRGATRAPRLVVLGGDGAPWIWGIAGGTLPPGHPNCRFVPRPPAPVPSSWAKPSWEETLPRSSRGSDLIRSCWIAARRRSRPELNDDNLRSQSKPLVGRGRPASSTSRRMRSECVTLASAARDFSSARASSKRAARPSLANV